MTSVVYDEQSVPFIVIHDKFGQEIQQLFLSIASAEKGPVYLEAIFFHEYLTKLINLAGLSMSSGAREISKKPYLIVEIFQVRLFE